MTDPCPDLDPERWRSDLAEDEAAMRSARFGAELERGCLRRLAEAWHDLNYRHLRSRLRSPSIRLHEGERRWGAWHPEERLLTISRRQVLCYTWESVLETLKHEVAHQFVSEVLGRDDEAPHGPAFQEACRLLACDPSPRGDGGVPLFRPGGAGRQASPEDGRLTRIQKLLALADNNPDEHEARAAFARASELMLKYNLDAEPAGGEDYCFRHLGPCSGRVPHYRYLIASILQEYFFVQCIWVDSYVVRTGTKGHVLEVLGTRANVDMADYVHDCLLRQSLALWKGFKAEHGIKDQGGSAKRQYLDGLLNGFRRQLARTARASEERGLVWVGDPGLEAYTRKRYPRTTRCRLDSVAASEIRQQGVQAGERLRLHRPVAEAGRDRGRLLPG